MFVWDKDPNGMWVLANEASGYGEIYGPFDTYDAAHEYLKQRKEELARNYPNGRRNAVTFATYTVRKLKPVAVTKAVETA